ncbi:hypothetical protein VKT23_014652 [Stygiomarasmius scandens]|uniref:Uncharacterized protein n=1 Tax=Marasmiellus scandens TaxID=2682957 RepID=A0ABR1IZS6_9AGAR
MSVRLLTLPQRSLEDAFDLGSEDLVYPPSPIAAPIEHPMEGQYVFDGQILTRLQSKDLIPAALSDLSKLLSEYMTGVPDDAFLIIQNPDDPDKTIEKIQATFIRELCAAY